MSETANTTSAKPKSELKEIGALWRRDSNNGKYLTGNIDGKSVVIFSNKFKKAENQPDLRVYLSNPKPATAAKPAVKPAAPAKAAVQAPEPEPAPDDEII